MEDDETALPRIYLITPPVFDLELFPRQLAAVLDGTEVACLRLALAATDESEIARAADQIREVAHPRDIPVVLCDHVALAARLGLDGVHLDGHRGVRAARKALGDEAIVGCDCGASRHDGITAGEIGADYVAFGPLGDTGLGDGTRAPIELFEWWSEMIEVPVVAEGGLTPDLITALATTTDFLGIGAEIWSDEAPDRALQSLLAPLTGTA